MILRKPYGFLIKHFRFIHLVITAILFYVAKYSTSLYEYINSCIFDNVNKYNALSYIDNRMYVFVGCVLVLFLIICWLLKYKDKPRKIYIISIIGYFAIAIYLYILFGYFGELSNNIIDQKVIRAYRDITLMTLVFQYIVTLIMFIRGLGFDVKKFNFTKDIQELNLTSEDAEEVEVDVNLNSNVVMREIRKQKRELGYFYKEYKIFILGIFAIIIFSLSYFGYKYLKSEFKVYDQGDMVGYNYNIVINNSYFNISSNKKYVIVKFDVFKYGLEDKLNLNNLKLLVNDQEYIPNKNVCSKFDYLGSCYKKQYINEDVRSYIITYEVEDLDLEKAFLLYIEGFDETYKIGLNLENYD